MQQLPNTYELTFPAQPFPAQVAHPGALVHIPPGFDASKPLDLVVYSRGMNSCVTAVASNKPTACVPGGRTHHGSRIVEIFDAAKVNALLIFPEFKVEASTTDPGQLKNVGGTMAFLNGVLSSLPIKQALNGVYTVETKVRSVFLAAHSAGWNATAEMISARNVPVRGVALFDSMYGGTQTYKAFALKVCRGEIPNGRFSTLYIGGAPATNSTTLCANIRTQVPAESIKVGSSRVELTAEDFKNPAFFKLIRTEHHLVPEKSFRYVLEGGGFDRIM